MSDLRKEKGKKKEQLEWFQAHLMNLTEQINEIQDAIEVRLENIDDVFHHREGE